MSPFLPGRLPWLMAPLGVVHSWNGFFNGGGRDRVMASTPGGVWPRRETEETAVRHNLCGGGAGDAFFRAPGPTQITYVSGSTAQVQVTTVDALPGHFEFRLCKGEPWGCGHPLLPLPSPSPYQETQNDRRRMTSLPGPLLRCGMLLARHPRFSHHLHVPCLLKKNPTDATQLSQTCLNENLLTLAPSARVTIDSSYPERYTVTTVLAHVCEPVGENGSVGGLHSRNPAWLG
jgi:hypothetical protein